MFVCVHMCICVLASSCLGTNESQSSLFLMRRDPQVRLCAKSFYIFIHLEGQGAPGGRTLGSEFKLCGFGIKTLLLALGSKLYEPGWENNITGP